MLKAINISFELLNNTISLLEEIELEDYDLDFVQLFGYVSHSLYNKRDASDPCCPFALLSRDVDRHPYPCCDQCGAPRSEGGFVDA